MNLPAQALARYGTVKVTTASPGALLVMLYDALFRFLREAQMAMEAHDAARSSERTGRAIAILEQLMTGLDRRHVPELCDRLEGLYGFCIRHLTHAMAQQDVGAVAEVVRILTPLRAAWALAVERLARDAEAAKR